MIVTAEITEDLTLPELLERRQMVRVTQIRADGGTQMRAALNPETVADYADILYKQERTLDWPFPTLVLFYDGSDYWLADGFHRLAAFVQTHHIANNPDVTHTLPCLVHPGTRRDAILYAAAANATHGLRRTNADKRRAVETLLRDEEWRQWSDAEIARRCAVDPKTVGNIRQALESDREIPDSPIRKRADGATVNVTNVGANPPRRDPEPRPAEEAAASTPPAATVMSQNVRSLLYTPPEDTNFRWALEKASIAELEQALTAIPAGTPGHKTRIAVVERRLRKLQKATVTPVEVPTVNELIADTEAAYKAMFAEDAPVDDAPAVLDDLPLVDSAVFPGLTAAEQSDRRRQFAWLHTVYREAKDSLEDYEAMTGDFASRRLLWGVLEPMVATLERHLSAYETDGAP